MLPFAYRTVQLQLLGCESAESVVVGSAGYAEFAEFAESAESAPVVRCREARLRMAGASKAGPCVTDNGNFLVDAVPAGPIHDPASVERAWKRIPGIVETGLFVAMAQQAYFGMDDGYVPVCVWACGCVWACVCLLTFCRSVWTQTKESQGSLEKVE